MLRYGPLGRAYARVCVTGLGVTGGNIAENNVTDFGTSVNNGLNYLICATVEAFNTRKPDGTFSQGYDPFTLVHLPELTTDVEDVLLAF